MDIEDFNKNYPRLTQVLLGFLDASEDRVSDEEKVIASGYLDETVNHLQVEQLKTEMDSVLALEMLPWTAVRTLTNRYFATPEDCRQWLIKILPMIESWAENEAHTASPSNG